MDTSIFLSSRRKILFWIIGPPLFLAIFYFLSLLYVRILTDSLKEHKLCIESLPSLVRKSDEADAILRYYRPLLVYKSEPIELLHSEFNKMAEQSDFTINSLVIQKRTREENVSGFDIAVKGEGNLKAINNFLNQIQLSERLLSVEAAYIKAAGLPRERAYNADFIFSYKTLAGEVGKIDAMQDTDRFIQKLDKSMAFIRDKQALKGQKTVAKKVDEPVSVEKEEHDSIPRVLFNGVAKNTKKLFAFINDRVLGLGGKVENFEVIDIQEDRVTLKDKRGNKKVLYLNKKE